MLRSDIDVRHALRHLSVPETDRYAIDRRRFLQLVGAGLGAGMLSGPGSTLLDALLPGHDPSAWAAGPVGSNDGILVVLGMYGGNDGLNTVIADDPLYRQQHGSLAVQPSQALPLGGGRGLHPSLTTMKALWDRGNMAVVEGLGYPNPDLSHFASMGFWMAGQPGSVSGSGWLGRWLDGQASPDVFTAAEVGTTIPLHLVGRTRKGAAVPPDRPGFGGGVTRRDDLWYETLRAMRHPSQTAWQNEIGTALAEQLDVASAMTTVLPDRDPTRQNDIVTRLEVAARLINANLGFRVITAGWHDFDSHAGQPTMHGNRMVDLNAALARFYEVLLPGWGNRVTIMTFSEFGRTSWANDGMGTDHGTAAPHFVMGENVQGGFYGDRPSLSGLGRWDRMQHTVDFRSYYASILDGWLGGGSTAVLGKTFENLGLFQRGPGVLPDGTTAPLPVAVSAKLGFVPVAPSRLADTRSGHRVPAGPIGPDGLLKVQVSGIDGLPASGIGAIVANVTSVDATEPTYLTVFPGGSALPNTSNVNSGPGRPVPNLVVLDVGADGSIDVFNKFGSSHCLVDIFGYFSSDGAQRFTALPPKRLFDTRTGVGVRHGKIGPVESVVIDVAGSAGVPSSGATAVVLNLTVTEPDDPGFLRLTPNGAQVRNTSNVNFGPGDTVPNLTICKLGDDGRLALDGAGLGKHAIGDVFGYFSSGGDSLQTCAPRRLLDTREGFGAVKQRVGPSHSLDITLAGLHGVAQNATAVVLNVTVTNVAGPSFLKVWPRGTYPPDSSNLNMIGGQTTANLVICELGDGGGLSLANDLAECDVIADVFGYFVR